MTGSGLPSRGHSGRRVECGPGVCCNGLSKEPAEGSGLGWRLLPGQRVRCPSMPSSGGPRCPFKAGAMTATSCPLRDSCHALS